MKTKQLILAGMLTVVFVAITQTLLGQEITEMSDLFDVVNDQVQESTSVISSIMYALAGIFGMVGGGLLIFKIIKGQDAGKDIGSWFAAMAFFCVVCFICGKFFE